MLINHPPANTATKEVKSTKGVPSSHIMNTVQKIAAFLINHFGSKELALAELTKGQIWFWNSDIFRDTVVTFLAGENVTRNEGDGMNNRGWWCNDNTSWCVTLKNKTLSVSWLNYEAEKKQLFKLLGGYTGQTVSIECTHNFNGTINPTKTVYNAPYGIYGTYYDIVVEIGSPLWVEALWHQVNFTATGFTKEEFMLPKYAWLHKLLPIGLGSNRKDGHSAFSWESSYSIKKEGKTITLNGDKVYTLRGKKLYSNLEKELEKATPKAPKDVPFIQTESTDYGTTVSLGRWDSSFVALLNATVKTSCDFDKIADKYKIRDDVNWSKRYVSVAYPETPEKHCCVLQEDRDNNNYETETYWWLFPGKTTWVSLKKGISLRLLKKLKEK